MYYLNLPLEIWQYVIIFVILLSIFIGYLVFQNKNLNPYSRFLSVWLAFLIVLNFLNMYTTIGTFLKYSKVSGEKGAKGDPGPRGYRGKSFTCNQCGNAGQEMEDVYGSNLNDNNQKIDDPKLQRGKCVFPFVFDNEFQYECVKQPRVPGTLNDASTYGWCATSTNNDLTYKTFGYCKDSENEKQRLQANALRAENLKEFQQKNYGLMDVDVVSGIRSDVKCPAGYRQFPTDLNSLADGSYIYLCAKYGFGDKGITQLNTVEGACPEGSKRIDVDLNENSGGKPIYLCKKKSVPGSSGYVRQIKIVKNKSCPTGFAQSMNLNEGAGGDSLYLCTSSTRGSSMSVDAAFVYKDSIYFFFDKKCIEFDNRKNKTKQVISTNQKFGKLPSNLDAAMVYPYDDQVYFFKGSLFWKIDMKRSKIASGYPQKISDVWKGIPDNLDAIYVRNRKTFFIKGGKYFLFDSKNKVIKPGYPKNLDNKFENASKLPSAVFYWPYKNQTIIIESSQARIYKNDKEQSNSPMPLSEIFPGLPEN